MIVGSTGGVWNKQHVTAWALSLPLLEEVYEKIDVDQMRG